MRYCFVLPYFDEQRNSFSKLLAPVVKELLANHHDVCILSANEGYSGEFSSCHKALSLKLKKPSFLYVLNLVLASSLWLWRRRKEFDVIHNLGVGSSLYQNVLTAHACHRAWIEVKWKQGQYWSLFLNPLHALTFALETCNYSRPIPVIAVHEALAQELIRFYPQTKGRITVINNAVEPPKVITPVPRLDSGKAGFIISTASNDHRKKGLFELIDALAIAHKAGKTWYLQVLGHDPRQSVWEDYANKKGLQNYVVFAGHVHDICNYFAASDLFCLGSPYESFGLVFLEAAQIACPIVGTHVGVLPDLLRGFENSRFASPLPLPLQVEELYDRLSILESSAELRFSLGKHGQNQAKHFSISLMVEKYLSFYKNQFEDR